MNLKRMLGFGLPLCGLINLSVAGPSILRERDGALVDENHVSFHFPLCFVDLSDKLTVASGIRSFRSMVRSFQVTSFQRKVISYHKKVTSFHDTVSSFHDIVRLFHKVVK